MDQQSFKDSITVDESTKRQEMASGGCPIMELRIQDDVHPRSAFITSKDCDSKARVLCTLDLSQPTKIEKKPNLGCLQAFEMTSKNGKETNGRRKRDINNRMDEQVELKIKGKMSVYIILIS